MPVLGTGIHDFGREKEVVDARNKSGHDDLGCGHRRRMRPMMCETNARYCGASGGILGGAVRHIRARSSAVNP